ELRKANGIRRRETKIAKLQPLAGEVFDQRLGATIRKHPANLLLEHFGTPQAAALSQIEQHLVWNAAPEEEGQTRGELEIRRGVRLGSRDGGGLPLDAEQEVRADEHLLKRELNARLEAAFPPALGVDVLQIAELAGRQGVTERTASQRRQDFRRTRALVA